MIPTAAKPTIWPDFIIAPVALCEADMLRVDGYYLYQMGAQIHPLSFFRGDPSPDGNATSHGEAILPLIIAEGALEPFLTRSIFKLRTSVQHGSTLLQTIRTIKDMINGENAPDKKLDLYTVYALTSALVNFEAVLASEFGLLDLYIVSKKGGLDTTDLIWNGQAFFAADLANKAPEAIPDIQQATKCLAFELPTAAGFHLHRAHESVLHRYYDAVTGGKPRPTNRNIGDYLAKLNEYGVGDAKVKSALKDLKDLHRNPLIHPEHSLDSVDEAIDLLGSVRAVVGHMLKELPALPPPAPPVIQGTTAPGASGLTS